MPKVKVWPRHETALRAYSGTTRNGTKLGHPVDGDLRLEGSSWEFDSFTHRAITDKDVTTDENLKWPPKADPLEQVGV